MAPDGACRAHSQGRGLGDVHLPQHSPDELEINKSLTGSTWPFLRRMACLIAWKIAAEPGSSEPVKLDLDVGRRWGGLLGRRGQLSMGFSCWGPVNL